MSLSSLQRACLYGGLAFALCFPAQAAPLTLREALDLAEKHSPVLSYSSATAQAAQAAAITARAFPNPELELSGGTSRPRQAGLESSRVETIGLAQPIELPGLRSSRRSMAEAGVNASTAAQQQTRLELHSRIRLAFYDALRRQEEAGVAAGNRALLYLLRNRVKLKVEVGESPRYEQIKAEAEALAADSAFRSAQLRVNQAKSVLRGLIGVALEDFDLIPEPAASAEAPPLDSLEQELLARHPQLRVAEAETRRAQARVEMERAARLPQPTLKLNSERNPDARQWMVGVALPLPLWNRRDGPIGEAVAGLHQSEAEAERIRLALLTELEQVYGRYLIARSQVKTFETGLLKEAENAMRVAEAAYRFGERSILDYIDAQRVLRATRLDFIHARYELQAALIELDKLRAAPLAGDLP